MVPAVRGSQAKSGNFKKSGSIREVREFKNTRVQKLTKMQKKILNCCMQTAYNSSEFFPARFAHRLFLPPLLNLFRRSCC